MSLASRLVIALLGLALIWFFWPFGGSEDAVQTTGYDRLFTTKPREQPRLQAPPEAPVSQSPADTSGASQKTGADKTAAAAAVPLKPKLTPKRFYRVRVLDSATLEASDFVIKLEGVSPIPSDENCEDSGGTKWLCGTRARMALTRFIRGRAVVCKVPESGKARNLTARCTLASQDLSIWVAAQGWAKPAKPVEPKIAEAVDEARKKKIGIWR